MTVTDTPLPPNMPRKPFGLARLLGGAVARPPASLPEGQRIYAIGDVHGRLDLLDTLLEYIRLDDEAWKGDGQIDTQVVLLGDLIDRGPESAGVVRRAMEGLDWASLVTLKGNHEAAMLGGLDGDYDLLRLWLDQGGDSALVSWGVPADIIQNATMDDLMDAANAVIPAAELAWLSARPISHRSGDYYFVHAGVRPGVALDRQTEHDSLWIRDPFLNSRRDHGAMVVHGHTRTAAVDPRPNRIGIDTGAYATGKLSALGLEGDHRWVLST